MNIKSKEIPIVLLLWKLNVPVIAPTNKTPSVVSFSNGDQMFPSRAELPSVFNHSFYSGAFLDEYPNPIVNHDPSSCQECVLTCLSFAGI